MEPSPLAGLLPRLRTMRGGGVWPALTSFDAVSARNARVAEARVRVHDLPPPYTPVERTNKARRMLRRWFIVVLGFLLGTLVVAYVYIVTGYRQSAPAVTRMFRYNLATAPPFLAEPTALAYASRALADSGLDPAGWVPMQLEDAKRTRGPDGRRDVFLLRVSANIGTIAFREGDSTNRLRAVNFSLVGSDLWCSVH
jgi:hypothetical protein